MGNENFKPFKLNSVLTGYMPIPRELISMDLPSTAKLIYAVLLDRATLSQKNHYADESGWVYVIYPIENLAQTFKISDTAVKRHLKELEAKGLIIRRRANRNGPSYIYLNLPPGATKEGTNRPVPSAKPPPRTGRKVPPNNKREQKDFSNYYQHREDESL